MGRLLKREAALADDVLENVCLAALGQDRARDALADIDAIGVRLCAAAADHSITIEELTECLQELKKLRLRVNHEWLNEEVRDEAIGRRICQNVQREPLHKQRLPQTLSV